jgi:hypothetical protein
LRYFREGRAARVERAQVDVASDRALLLAHWAMSSKTLELWRYAISHKHELETILSARLTEGLRGIRGRLNAIQTVVRRRVTGNAALFAYYEPRRSYNVGPNQLVAWILRKAHLAAKSLSGGTPSPYSNMRDEALKLTYNARRLEAMKSLAQPTFIQSARLSASAIKQAARSRRSIYRRAHETYELLRGIEDGSENAINAVLRETLIAPLKDWQTFELMTALGIARSIERRTGMSMRISDLTLGMLKPIIRIGQYSLYWQKHGPEYLTPSLEMYEGKVDFILRAYGAPFASDRPDLTIVDESLQRTIAIVEAKFFSAEISGRDAFRLAVEQVVRYARGYSHRTPLDDLLGCSLVALWSRREIQSPATLPTGVPILVDFEDLLEDFEGRLREWSAAVFARRVAPPFSGRASAS